MRVGVPEGVTDPESVRERDSGGEGEAVGVCEAECEAVPEGLADWEVVWDTEGVGLGLQEEEGRWVRLEVQVRVAEGMAVTQWGEGRLPRRCANPGEGEKGEPRWEGRATRWVCLRSGS